MRTAGFIQCLWNGPGRFHLGKTCRNERLRGRYVTVSCTAGGHPYGNGVSHGSGNGVSHGKGGMPSLEEPFHDDEDLEDQNFVIGYPVDSLMWCAADTSVEGGALESQPVDKVEDGELCDVELPNCGVQLTPRALTPYFVDTFRMSSVYINLFRDTTFVIHVPGAVAEEPLFQKIMEDIALLSIVGIKLVLVLGPTHQINQKVRERNIEESFVNGVRVTDHSMLHIIKEATGALLFEVESKLARGVVNFPTRNKMSVVSGNFFSAQPIGVIDGQDFGYTGKVRRIDVDAIQKRLDQRDVVLLSNIGFSPSGELFNCQSEAVAAACAAQLKAEKLIYLGANEVLFDTRTNSMVPNLPLRTAKLFFKRNNANLPPLFRLRMNESIRALSAGVRRAHILNRFVDGALLMEIFHRDGVGIMVSRDLYEGVRPARLSDLGGIFEIIEPLMKSKVLIPRSIDQLEQDIDKIVVAERDGMVIALATWKVFPEDDTLAELACFAVHPNYRRSGKGSSLLSYVERVAYASGVRKLFLLSTQSFSWFHEREFKEVDVSELPESKRKQYNKQRNSKVLMKLIHPADELEELLIQVHDEAFAS